ncbi:MAG TPA: MBL fold metallo-hydrolase [Burkholderiales bacterium]|jgi:phosphoribosyl 1,2-cyclic phosphodiesterase|nr:MBL fold metallo-hydrolase [Burkholderiales bacterium]
MTFSVRFWGVRGSIACPGPRTARYGGNTSSLEVRCGERMLLFDAGTGLRYLGNSLQSSGPIDADLFLTHTHFDHVAGLPFFKPFFKPHNRFRLWAGHLAEGMTLRRVLGEFMMSPLFPVPPQVFRARMEYREFKAGDTLHPAEGIALRTAPLNHPDGATGYRVDYGGRSICYLTDTEHVPGAPDRNILGLIAGADLVIYDSMYTDAEYDAYVGWGHSTWQEGVRLCRAAGAKRLAVFHHDPEHEDDMLDGVAREVEKELPGSIVARDGLVVGVD